MPIEVTGRTRHYGTFYGLPRRARPKRNAMPLLLVYGNCQAEALRVLLAGSKQLGWQTVRIPPVFELTAADVPFVRRLARRSQILLSQPVVENYHNLPLGTDDVAGMMNPGSSVIRWPVVQFAGFHPYQAIIRDPNDPERNPPVVPYHDLRTLASAQAGRDLSGERPSEAASRVVADESRAELRRRERRGCDIAISDVFDAPVYGDMATINHPGNRVLIELAHRVQDAIGSSPDAVDPGRTLLGEVVTPVDPLVLRALQVSGAGRKSWLVGGRRVNRATVHKEQLRWYRANPQVVEAGYDRHRPTLELLGLA